MVISGFIYVLEINSETWVRNRPNREDRILIQFYPVDNKTFDKSVKILDIKPYEWAE